MSAIAQQPRPVTRVIDGVRSELASVTQVPLWSMDGPETAATLTELAAAKAQIAELEARLLTHAAVLDLPGRSGATSTANWYAVATRITRPVAHRTTRVAQALESHESTREALAAGTVNPEQAAAILRAVQNLPDDLDPDQVTEAERHLLDQAAHFDATALKRLGRRLLEVIAPDLADAHEAQGLEREEREAAASQRLTMWEDGHGKVHGRFTLDAVSGSMLKKALLGFAAPKHRAAVHGPLVERKPIPERLGAAFAELIQRYPTDRLPNAGGINATIVVTMTLDSLMGGLKAARLDTGHTISASLARRMACEAKIIPAVLGGQSEVLDLGRSRRFHSTAHRIAATIEQGGCCIRGCDHPPGLTHMHHPTPWSQGGPTNRDGLMLCAGHHTRAHDPTYTMTRLPTGKYDFHRRT